MAVRVSTDFGSTATTRVLVLGAALSCLMLSACPGGERETVDVSMLQHPKDLPPDDELDAKNPPFLPYYTVGRQLDEEQFYMNTSRSVLSVDIPEFESESSTDHFSRLYPSFAAALGGRSNGFGSLDMIDRFTKSSDDTIYASVEYAVHEGNHVFLGGKQGLLSALLKGILAQPASPQRELAAGFLASALRLGGGSADVPPSAAALSKTITAAFEANKMWSKPIGFYAGDDTLEKVFRRDRLLQQPFGMGDETGISGQPPDIELAAMALIAAELQSDPALLEAYSRFQRLAEKITNPTSNLDLRDMLPHSAQFADIPALRSALQASAAWQTKVTNRNASSAGVAFWPYSYSKEAVLINSIPPEMLVDESFMDIFTRAIQSGDVDLAPASDSGWYDYQTFALETLLLPERAQESSKLLLRGAYKQRLKNAFEALITQRRETHIKQLEIAAEGAVGKFIDLSNWPELQFEPVLTNYLRTARGYAMLDGALTEVFGPGEFASINTKDGQPLDHTLEHSKAVFYGLYLLGCNQIGMAAELEPGELNGCMLLEPANSKADGLALYPVAADPALDSDTRGRYLAGCSLAKDWLSELWKLPIMADDPRVIVPVSFDPVHHGLRCWAVLGIKVIPFEVAYAVEPEVISASKLTAGQSIALASEMLEAGKGSSIEWEPLTADLLVYDFAEVLIGAEPLTREQFRSICDKAGSRQAILHELENLR